MNDLGLHVVLFLFSGSIIVVVGTFFAEPDDREALRALPKRLWHFFAGCAVVIALMLLFEHTFASIH